MKPIKVGNPDVGVKMKHTGVADLNVFVRMKPTLMKMNPIEGGNPNVGVKLKPTAIADFNVFVKMKPILMKMKPIEDGNPNVDVKMKGTRVKRKDHEQILVDGFCFMSWAF